MQLCPQPCHTSSRPVLSLSLPHTGLVMPWLGALSSVSTRGLSSFISQLKYWPHRCLMYSELYFRTMDKSMKAMLRKMNKAHSTEDPIIQYINDHSLRLEPVQKKLIEVRLRRHGISSISTQWLVFLL